MLCYMTSVHGCPGWEILGSIGKILGSIGPCVHNIPVLVAVDGHGNTYRTTLGLIPPLIVGLWWIRRHGRHQPR